MCYSPTLIKNPNYGRRDKMAYVVDTKSQYIPVPCGHCGECVRLRSSGILQRAQLEELYGYPYMISLSYNPESLAYYECSNGFSIAYSPVSDLQNMFKRLRKSGKLTRRFRYYAVTELGSKKGRPHAHILLFLQRQEGDSVYTPFNLEKIVFKEVLKEWRRNYATRIKHCKKFDYSEPQNPVIVEYDEVVPDTFHPDYRPLLTYISRMRCGKLHSTYDCHYVTPSVVDGSTQDVSFYVTKYLVKDSEFKDKLKRNIYGHCASIEEANEVWSIVRPRAISSLNFGFGIYDDLNPRKTSKEQRLAILNSLPSASIVRSCVERSSQSEKTARFYDLQTGKSMPLARYWYKFGDIYDLDHHNLFLSRQDRVDGVSIDDRDMTSKLIAESKHINNSKDSLTSNYDLLYAES